MFIAVVGLVFYFVPNAKVRFRDVWVGAVVTGLAWRGALFGFSYYVRDLTRFSNVHGSIAAVVVFLVWIYISAVLLLYGVEVTAANARLRRHRPDEIPAAPTPRGVTDGQGQGGPTEPERRYRAGSCVAASVALAERRSWARRIATGHHP